jgi:hypothetical protein
MVLWTKFLTSELLFELAYSWFFFPARCRFDANGSYPIDLRICWSYWLFLLGLFEVKSLPSWLSSILPFFAANSSCWFLFDFGSS